MALEPGGGRLRQQRTERCTRQQQVRRARSAEQRVAQHAQEHRRAGLIGGSVQGRHAKRLDQLTPHFRGQPLAQIGDAQGPRTAKAQGRPARRGGQQRQPLGPAPAPSTQHCAYERRDGRAAMQLEALAVGILQRQWQAPQQRARVGADLAHQRQRGLVGADQDVLAVVQRLPAHMHRAGPAAGLGCHLEHLDRVSGLARVDRRRDAGPAGADDGHAQGIQRPRQWVRHAIHSLRSGVSEVRWCSTRKPSASISRSSVR